MYVHWGSVLTIQRGGHILNISEPHISFQTESPFPAGLSILFRRLAAMKTKEKKIERRKHQRFSAKNGTFALVGSKKACLDKISKMGMAEIACAIYKSEPLKFGQIIDMSQGGLAFNYIDNRKRRNPSDEINILSAGNKFFLENLLFKTVMDVDATEEPSYSPIKLRHQRIQFVGLSSDQIRKLEYFLSNHTDGEMTSQ